MTEPVLPYADFLAKLRRDILESQGRAARTVNTELLMLYWRIGTRIAAAQEEAGWGSGLIPRLARDLKNELSEVKGFSERNLGYMVRFAKEYGPAPIGGDGESILQPAVAKLPVDASTTPILQSPIAKLPSVARPFFEILFQIPWGHNLILMDRVKDLPTRLWYAEAAAAGHWTQDRLIDQIRVIAHERAGTAVDNFSKTLEPTEVDKVRSSLKDPYLFDFLSLDVDFRERELEAGLVAHLQDFLLELGVGFAFVGRQYRLELEGTEYFLDLLFYHLRLRRFVVIELKRGPFLPEYAGKLNFYLNLVDDSLRQSGDESSIGLVLCQERNRVVAEYALRGIDKSIGVSEYQLTQSLPESLASSLPRIEDIEAELEQFGEGQT